MSMTDNDSIGYKKILNCGSFSQKLGIACDDILIDILRNTNFSDDFSQHLCSANWNC